MNKSGYVENKWHACHPLFVDENSQEIQHDCIYRRDRIVKRFSGLWRREMFEIESLVRVLSLRIEPET